MSTGTEIMTAKDLSPEDMKYLDNPSPASGFDLRTHIINPTTGKLLRKQPYRLVKDKDHGSYFVRDGKMYSEQGQLLSLPETEPARKAK